ncbi:MAG: TatD family hydrolase [Syntrophomonadales bacterium]|jgi:TatD DNase family protein
MRQQPESLTVIDSHAHLQDPRFAEDVEEVIARAIQGGVEMIICIGYDLESSRAAVELTRRHREIWAVVGIHPHDAKTINDRVLAEVWDLARDPRVVAIGETGLDYYRNLSSPDEQRKGFRAQINLAKKLGKPIVIHDRDAHEEVLSIIKQEKAGANGGIMHCYSGRLPLAVELMKQGFMISFAGPLTFSNAKKSVEVAARVPLDRILVETDCPYLTPEPYRGKRNEPLYVWEVAKKLAEIHRKSLQEIAYITAYNTRRVLGL